MTATLSGQIVMEGFLDIRLPPWLRRLVTRIYFEDAAENAEDPVLALVADPVRRATLLARRVAGDGTVYRFDIVLQGEGETVFFEC